MYYNREINYPLRATGMNANKKSKNYAREKSKIN